MNWLNDNTIAILGLVISIVSLIIAITANKRSKKVSFAAFIDTKMDFTNMELTIYNNGNGSARKVELTAKGCEFGGGGNTRSIQLICPKKNCPVFIMFPNKHFDITMHWDDDFKKGNKKTWSFTHPENDDNQIQTKNETLVF